MTKIIHLHGGPWHGKKVAVEDGRDHLHISQPVPGALQELAEPALADTLIPRREGTYSQVNGMPGNFEWDGWRTHA